MILIYKLLNRLELTYCKLANFYAATFYCASVCVTNCVQYSPYFFINGFQNKYDFKKLYYCILFQYQIFNIFDSQFICMFLFIYLFCNVFLHNNVLCFFSTKHIKKQHNVYKLLFIHSQGLKAGFWKIIVFKIRNKSW